MKLSLPEIKKRLRSRTRKILILSKRYCSADTPLRCLCCVCAKTWRVAWADLNRGYGCPRCGKTGKLTTAEVRRRLKTLHSRIRVIGEYEGSMKPLRCLCTQCKNEWMTTWNRLTMGSSCPNCCDTTFKSENDVRAIIEKLTGTKWPRANPSDVPFLHGLHLDGYDKKNRRGFEFDGPQHRKVVHRFHGSSRNAKRNLLASQRRDWRKNFQCRYHGVKLIRIPYRVRDRHTYIKAKLERLGWLKGVCDASRREDGRS